MRTIIVYDSWYGNTETIARAIAHGTGKDTTLHNLERTPDFELSGSGLLIVGSPTHGGVASPRMQEFLSTLTAERLQKRPVAVFDTRLKARWVRVFGYAAPRISGRLERLGAQLVVPPEGFHVISKEGPLAAEEVGRATSWGRRIIMATRSLERRRSKSKPAQTGS